MRSSCSLLCNGGQSHGASSLWKILRLLLSYNFSDFPSSYSHYRKNLLNNVVLIKDSAVTPMRFSCSIPWPGRQSHGISSSGRILRLLLPYKFHDFPSNYSHYCKNLVNNIVLIEDVSICHQKYLNKIIALCFCK